MKDEPFEISSSSTFRTFTEEGDLESAASRQLRAIPCTWDNIYRTEKIEYLQDKSQTKPTKRPICLFARSSIIQARKDTITLGNNSSGIRAYLRIKAQVKKDIYITVSMPQLFIFQKNIKFHEGEMTPEDQA